MNQLYKKMLLNVQEIFYIVTYCSTSWTDSTKNKFKMIINVQMFCIMQKHRKGKFLPTSPTNKIVHKLYLWSFSKEYILYTF